MNTNKFDRNLNAVSFDGEKLMSQTHLLQKLAIASVAGVISVIGVHDKSLANPFVSQGPFVKPRPGDIIPGPLQVQGKEFSNKPDRNAANANDPEQNIFWDGAGGVADAYDYSGNGEVDALSNASDTLFDEVIADLSHLLFSTDNDPNIYFERRQVMVGGIWAAAPQIDAMNPPTDVDGLEVWGKDGPDIENANANRYSLEFDPFPAGNPGDRVAVWDYDFEINLSTPLYTVSDIGTAIGLEENLWSQLDLDAMMTSGDSIMFSIDPLGGFDGGEIWVWDGTGVANFLQHGGHLWDTAFDVMGTYNTASENINALEAVSSVPEPSFVLGILVASGLGLGLKHKKRQKS